MKRELAEAIVEALNESGFEAELYEDYSGRGMYGRTCTGVSLEGDIADALEAVISCADKFVDEDLDPRFSVGTIHSDSLGCGTIIY